MQIQYMFTWVLSKSIDVYLYYWFAGKTFSVIGSHSVCLFDMLSIYITKEIIVIATWPESCLFWIFTFVKEAKMLHFYTRCCIMRSPCSRLSRIERSLWDSLRYPCAQYNCVLPWAYMHSVAITGIVITPCLSCYCVGTQKNSHACIDCYRRHDHMQTRSAKRDFRAALHFIVRQQATRLPTAALTILQLKGSTFSRIL